MPDRNLATVCGLYCGDCEHFGKGCEGCENVKGRPFWTTQLKMDTCPLYGCCRNKKNLEHCGLCNELPCEIFNKFHDPSLSAEEAKQNVLDRKSGLLRRKKTGTDRWIEEMK